MWKDAQIMLREKVCKIAHKKMIFFKGESYVYVVTHTRIHTVSQGYKFFAYGIEEDLECGR